MADHAAHGQGHPVPPNHLGTAVPSAQFGGEHKDEVQQHQQTAATYDEKKGPMPEDDEEDEDMDQLIADLESQDGHIDEIDEEDDDQPGGERPVPDELLQTDTRTGLTDAEVTTRRKKYGLNQMKEEKENLILKFFSYFVGPIQFVMEAAAILAAGLRDWVDFGVICALLLLNACVGFIQEFQAGSIVDELKKTLALKAVVLRNGRLVEVEAPEVVPGDILQVEEGTIIPADGRVVTEDAFLQVDQSAITGESLAVDKHKGDHCYASSSIKRGEAFMVVTSTGDNTFVGRAAALVNAASAGSGHFTEVLNGIGTVLLILVIFTLLVAWVASFYRSNGIVTILEFTLAITIIGVPVGLPAVVTTTMAVGAAYLAKKKAIVQKLSAIESLAGVEILCSDKTGTLTKNKLSLAEPYCVSGVDPEDLMLTASRSPEPTSTTLKRLGLGGGGTMPGSDIYDFVEAADGFAEVFPQHKYNVVEILQQRGYLVAMTGDGVNDAPSLKKADTGIAVEGASDAARSAADIVFLAPGLSAIIDALKTSRQIFHRMYAYVVYRIALSLHLEIFLGLWIAILNTSLNLQLVVFIAIFADIATLAIAYDNAPFSKTPVKWNLPKLWGMSVLLGVILAIGTWITLTTLLVGGKDGGIVQNFGQIDPVLFLEISLTENWLIFITRANGPFWSSIPSWQLSGAILVVDIIATLFTIFGWFVGGQTSIVAVVRVWVFSFGVFCVLGGIYYLLQGSTGFDNMMHGKSPKKSQKQRSLEDFVVSLQRVSTQHEKSA
ncbi:plasma membrane ATPase [Trichophyton tonsurans CBS 112818]|uniref:Plasma membrane ATPase n=1 Tax=Trichophyton tonsurans (strain CBS 112818) TaxID=647933 RepID=F2RMU6_TRIT1|nr:plasma membrane ATPase [Trichophyton tonsurans CBS 112818]